MRRGQSLYVKFFLVILVFFVLPLCLLFAYGYRHFETLMTRRIEAVTEANLEQMNLSIQRVIERSNQTANYLSTDVRLNSLLRTYDRQIPEHADFSYSTGCPAYVAKYDYLMLAAEVQGILSNYADNWLDADCQMGLLLNDGQLFTSWSSYNTDYEKLETVLSDSADRGMFFSPIHDSYIRYDSQTRYFTFVRRIYNIENTGAPLALLIISTPMQVIEDIVRSYQPDDAYSLYLTNAGGEVIFSLNGDEGLSAFSAELPDSEKSFINTSRIGTVDWTLHYVVPYSVLFAETLALRRRTVFIFLLCFLSIAAICFWMIYRLLAPLRQLTAGMKRAQQGEWDMPPLPVSSRDEIGTLTACFNHLIARLRQTLEQVRESEQQKSDLKFEMLLAQINPHFLFNTLNSIKWMAAMVHADNIVNTIRSLARLLEISMNRQADTISVGEEVKNLKSYLDIQAIRYTDLFTVSYDIDPALEPFETLKLVFQPIVENAIIHNIQEQDHLSIRIYGALSGNNILFEISDNGKGMTSEQVQRLLGQEDYNEKSVFRGIGVRNVRQRIQLKYGDEYGVFIQSAPGQGTTVRIVFPARLTDAPIHKISNDFTGEDSSC